MRSETTRPDSRMATTTTPSIDRRTSSGAARSSDADVALSANYVLDECMFVLGQAVGTRTTLDYDAVVWIRQHFHPKFVRAIGTFGDRWAEDRDNVTAVACMLGERAVRYAADRASIGVEEVRRAAADVERHCQLHSKRVARARGLDVSGTDRTLIAGYWCI